MGWPSPAVTAATHEAKGLTMAIECSAQALASAAKCYCTDKKTSESIKLYLLAVLAGLDNLTPSQLATRAKCFCMDAKTTKAVQNYLLCQLANAGGGPVSDCVNVEGAGDPT